jgi:Transcription antiterminator
VPVSPHAYFNRGDRVRVFDGPLTGLEGIFVRDKPNKGRLVVSINLLQTSVAVEVTPRWWRPANEDRGSAGES